MADNVVQIAATRNTSPKFSTIQTIKEVERGGTKLVSPSLFEGLTFVSVGGLEPPTLCLKGSNELNFRK